MKNLINKYFIGLASTIVLLAFTYGVVVGRYEVFPYSIVKYGKNTIFPTNTYAKPNSKTSNTHRLFQHFSPNVDIVFIGDSITNGGRWSEFFPTWKVANRGVGGDKASDIVRRLDSVISTLPSKAFIMVGINDIHQAVSVSNILDNYSIIIDTLKDENIDVYVQSTIQCEITICGARYVGLVDKLNNGLAELSLEKEVTFLHLGKLSEVGGLSTIYTTDGVHLTAEGYIYWVEALAPLLD
jgi:lysophospholipase L1-like esterase